MKSGYLQKKSSGCIQRWQTRHVSHTQEKNLTIKHDESSTRCRIFTIIDVVCGDDSSDLVITCHDGKSLHLRASSSTEREEWVLSFTRARPLTPDGPSSQPIANVSMPFSNHDVHTVNQRCSPPFRARNSLCINSAEVMLLQATSRFFTARIPKPFKIHSCGASKLFDIRKRSRIQDKDIRPRAGCPLNLSPYRACDYIEAAFIVSQRDAVPLMT
jgi:hypothetical protein